MPPKESQMQHITVKNREIAPILAMHIKYIYQSPNIVIYCQILENTAKYCQILPNNAKYCQIHLNIVNYNKM